MSSSEVGAALEAAGVSGSAPGRPAEHGGAAIAAAGGRPEPGPTRGGDRGARAGSRRRRASSGRWSGPDSRPSSVLGQPGGDRPRRKRAAHERPGAGAGRCSRSNSGQVSLARCSGPGSSTRRQGRLRRRLPALVSTTDPTDVEILSDEVPSIEDQISQRMKRRPQAIRRLSRQPRRCRADAGAAQERPPARRAPTVTPVSPGVEMLAQETRSGRLPTSKDPAMRKMLIAAVPGGGGAYRGGGRGGLTQPGRAPLSSRRSSRIRQRPAVGGGEARRDPQVGVEGQVDQRLGLVDAEPAPATGRESWGSAAGRSSSRRNPLVWEACSSA